ncbi:Rhodanese-like domain-containing protein [Aspergillus spectabilis]
MASIRQQPGDIACLISRATKHTVIGQRTTARNLSTTRQFRTAFLARPNSNQLRSQRYPTPLLSRITPTQRLPFVSAPNIRWSSEKSSTSTFRQWGFEDINNSLPSSNPTSPPSSPQKPLILIDVREPAELLSTGVIPSAVAVPLASQPDALFLTPDEFETRFGYPKPGVATEGGDIVFYCKAGVRARAAAQLAVQAGYEAERIGVYDGSWLDWVGRGGRVERWEGDE